MKLIKLTTFYPDYLREFYARRPDLVNASYGDQKAALDYDAFGWADFWKTAWTPLGYDVFEITANATSLQRAWFAENVGPAAVNIDLRDIAQRQIQTFRPDILFVEDFSYFSPTWLAEIKASCPSIRLLLVWCSAPYRDASVFRACDAVLSCVPDMVEQFAAQGHKAFHLNHAFDRRILERIGQNAAEAVDVSFVGSLYRGDGAHIERERLLREVVRERTVAIFSPDASRGVRRHAKWLAQVALFEGARLADRFGVGKQRLGVARFMRSAAGLRVRPVRPGAGSLKPYLHKGVYGLAMYRALQRSKVTLNSHIEISLRSASNMRLYEATGVGACLLTDWKENLKELFADDEVVSYRTSAECLEKLKWLLDHPAEREQIAARGQRRTLRDHSFQRRAEDLHDIIARLMRL